MARRKREDSGDKRNSTFKNGKNPDASSLQPKEKRLVWLQEKVEDFTKPPFSPEAQEESAGLLKRLRRGEKLELPQSRPMPSIGRSCHELRVRDAEANWRLVYYVDAEVVLVLHIFAKKTREMPQEVIELCQRRLGRYLEVRERIERLKKGK